MKGEGMDRIVRNALDMIRYRPNVEYQEQPMKSDGLRRLSVADLHWFPGSHIGAKQAIVQFPNGYAASVITGGIARGQYEIAVMRNGDLVYDTPITDDTLGYLSDDEVSDTLAAIAALPVPGANP